MLILAAELRLHGVPEDEAVTIVRRMPLDAMTPGEQNRHRRGVAGIVRWAYNPPGGIPILTGCPRAFRNDASQTGRLRGLFEPYCDDACKKTCCMLRGNRIPATALPGSPFENVWESSLWVSGAGLGNDGKTLYEVLAALAVAQTEANEPVWATSRYLARRLGHQIEARQIRRLLERMDSLGIITLEDRKKGTRHVRELSGEQVSELEAHLGTAEKVRERQLEVEREQAAFREWMPPFEED
jgi:hypothetical protein